MRRARIRLLGAAAMALAIVAVPLALSAGAILPPLPAPVGPIVDAVDDVVDAVFDIVLGDPADIPGEVEKLLTYQVHTVYPGPTGPVDKLTDAALLVPTPINVDDDLTTGSGGNDVAVQLTIDAGRATLRVQTLPNAPSPLPLAVEAIMPDPRRSSDFKVAFGYDALTDTAPAVYDATIALVGASRLSSFALDVTTVSPGSTLGVTAGVFDQGENGERNNPQHGRIDFTPVPTVTHVNVLTGSDLGLSQSGVDFVVNTPTTVDVLLEDVSGDDVTRAEGRIDKVPETLSLLLTANSSGAQNWSYRANARVGVVDFRVADTTGATVNDDFSVRLEDLPLEMSLLSDSPTHSTFQSTSPVGVIEAGFAHGGAVAELEDDAYLYQKATPGFDSLAFRVRGLSRAELSTADPTVIDVDMAAGPFHVLIENGARRIDGMIRDLPSSIRAELSTTGNQLSLVGNARIGEIVIDAQDPDGLAGRATDLDLRLVDLPESVTFSYGSEGGSAGVDAHDAVIGSVDLLLTSGPVIAVDDGFDGVILEDIDQHFALAARLNGLTEASVSTGGVPYELTLRKTAGPFLAKILQGARATRMEFLDLPSSLKATFDPAGSLKLASSAAIGEITAVIDDPTGVAGRATHASARLRDVPTTLDVTWNSAGGQVGVDAQGQTLGLIDVLLTSGPLVSVPAGVDGFVLEDVASHYGVAIRLNGLKKAVVSTGAAPYSLDIQKDAGPFSVRMLQGTRDTNIAVIDLPSSLQATIDPAGSLSYTASATIDSVGASVVDTAGVTAKAKRVSVALTGLPTSLTIDWAGGGGALTADAQGQTLGKIEFLLAREATGTVDSVPADRDGVIVRDTTAEYLVTGRITGLKKVTFTQGPPPSFTLDTAGGRIFQAEIDTQKPGGIATIDALITTLPTSLSVAMGTGSNFTYTASSVVSAVQLDAYDPANISGRANTLHATLNSLPLSLSVATAANGTITANAFGGTLGFLQFQLTSGPNDTLPSTTDGLLLNDLTDRYVMFARITGLKKAVGATSPAPNIDMQTTANRPFRLELNKWNGTKVEYNRATLNNLPSSVNLAVNGNNISYTASGTASLLSFDTNVGNRWNTHADLSGPVPASFTVCSASDISCTPSGDRGGRPSGGANASFRFSASQLTTINMFDCVQPANATCPTSPTEFNRITNLRVKLLGQDAYTSSSGSNGHIFVDTDNNTLSGQILSQQGNSGFRETFGSGFTANNRLGTWTGFGLWPFGSKDQTGSVNCSSGTELDVRFLGLWIPVTSYLC